MKIAKLLSSVNNLPILQDRKLNKLSASDRIVPSTNSQVLLFRIYKRYCTIAISQLYQLYQITGFEFNAYLLAKCELISLTESTK